MRLHASEEHFVWTETKKEKEKEKLQYLHHALNLDSVGAAFQTSQEVWRIYSDNVHVGLTENKSDTSVSSCFLCDSRLCSEATTDCCCCTYVIFRPPPGITEQFFLKKKLAPLTNRQSGAFLFLIFFNETAVLQFTNLWIWNYLIKEKKSILCDQMLASVSLTNNNTLLEAAPTEPRPCLDLCLPSPTHQWPDADSHKWSEFF